MADPENAGGDSNEQWRSVVAALGHIPEPNLDIARMSLQDPDFADNVPVLLTLEDCRREPAIGLDRLPSGLIEANFTEGSRVKWHPIGMYHDQLIVRQSGSGKASRGFMLLGGSIFLSPSIGECLTEEEGSWLAYHAWESDFLDVGVIGERGLPYVAVPDVIVRGGHVFYRPALELSELQTATKIVSSSMQQPVPGEVISILTRGKSDELLTLFVSDECFMTPPLANLQGRNDKNLL